MKVLVYGANGWIGSQFIELLENKNISFVKGVSRVDDELDVKRELCKVEPTHIISFIGRTHGAIGDKKYTTIDYLEQEGKLKENVRDNLYSPLLLAMLCKERNIHYSYLGTGCIFKFDEEHPFGKEENGFKEESLPNFFGSSYSIVKGFTDKLMHRFEENVLNLRIRMPITGEKNGRNFITKITSYEKICSVPNSMSVLPELLPYVIEMMKKKITGTMNLTNPGLISHNEMLSMYKDIVDPSFEWKNFSIEEQRKILASDRSNNFLDTSRLEDLFPEIDNIKTSVKKCLHSYKNSINDVIIKNDVIESDYSNIPLVIHHTGGNQDYFIKCVEWNSKKNKVYLIGDNVNKKTFKKNKNVEHIDIKSLHSKEIEEFSKYFVNYGNSGNSHEFELGCFLRVFYLKQLIKKTGYSRIFYVDSDCIVLDDINVIMGEMSNVKIGYSIQTFAQKKIPYHMVGCIHNSLINELFCDRFIEFCFDIYKTKSKFHLIEPKINHHKHNAGGICDMTIGYLCYENKVFDDPVSNFNDIYMVDGEECAFDHNIGCSSGYLGDETYKKDGDYKIINKRNGKYYAKTKENKEIRLLTIHYSGDAKALLAKLEIEDNVVNKNNNEYALYL